MDYGDISSGTMIIFRTIQKIKIILSGSQKKKIPQLAILMIIGGILETLSTSLMLPFMDVAMDPSKAMSNEYVVMLCNFLGIQTARTLLVFLALILALLYLTKNVYLMLEYNVQYRFVYKNLYYMQNRLLEALLHRPYEYFLNLNSGEMIRIVNTDTSRAFNSLTTLLALFTELVVTVMLLGAVFFIAPIITLVVALIMLVLLLMINAVIKPVIRKMALQNQNSQAGTNKWLLQSLQGIKDVKISGKEKFFYDNFKSYGKLNVKASQTYQTLVLVPRFLIEAACMSSMFIVVAVMLYRGVQLEKIIPALSTVAMAAIRLLPSVNRMSSAIGTIAFNEPSLDKTLENLNILNSTSGEWTSEKAMDKESVVPNLTNSIKFTGVSYRYPDSDNYVIENVSFEVKKGEAVGIVGPSGAGKTTTIDLMLSLLKPESGKILVDGVDVSMDPAKWISQIGYIPQMIFMLDDTIRANVAFGEPPSSVADEDVWRALEEAALADYIRTLPKGLDTEIGERGVRLSGGQRQRIGIARALYRNPGVLVFDEATSALDNDTENAIMESINRLQGNKTMIIIAHRLTTIEKCDHIYRVENGNITMEK